MRNQPWFVAEAIPLIDSVLNKNKKVFEWGSGGSTRWFADRAMKVVSVEHDYKWYHAVSSTCSTLKNVEVILRKYPPVENYTKIFFEMREKHGDFDVFVIDGRNRVECVKTIFRFLKAGDIVIFDDYHRPKYSEAKSMLQAFKFSRFEAPKIKPKKLAKTTSVFYV